MNYKAFYLGCLFFIFCIFNVRAEELCIEDKVCYDVKVVKTMEDKAKGLMFVRSMPENDGMLFDFEGEDIKDVAMWMKNTFIYLDMVFIGCDKKIKDVYKNDLFRGFDINNHFQEDIFSRIKDLYNLNILLQCVKSARLPKQQRCFTFHSLHFQMP